MRKNKGFSLVELIIVIAIIAGPIFILTKLNSGESNSKEILEGERNNE